MDLTAEQVAEWQRQQSEVEEERQRQLITEIAAFVASRGYELMAVPMLVANADGTFALAADWGIRPVKGGVAP